MNVCVVAMENESKRVRSLVSTRNYLKYCIKNEAEAVNTKFLDRDFKPIIRGGSTKMYRKGR